MEEIKARAWDEDNKKMWYWSSNNIYNDFWHHCRTLKHPIMLYSGIKDINGKEIYEGDIIKGGYVGYNIGIIIGEVIFDEGQFILKAKGSSRYSNTPVWFPVYSATEREVIGNIYENPELIK